MQTRGLTLDTSYLYPPGTTDLSTVAANLIASKPDAVFSGFTPTDQVSVLTQLNAAGLPNSVPMLEWGALNSAITSQANGRTIITYNPYAPVDLTAANPPADVQQFINALVAKLGHPLGATDIGSALLYYNAVPVLAKAIAKANTVTNPAAIGRAMVTVNAQGLGGPVRWSPAHQLLEAGTATLYSNGAVQNSFRIYP
jgi:ABC-type branched-subunit amino acid transport system substrate-binding protein